MTALLVIGLVWFFVFLIVSIVYFEAGSDVYTTSKLLEGSWQINQAIWWLLLSLPGLIAAMSAAIAMSVNQKVQALTALIKGSPRRPTLRITGSNSPIASQPQQKEVSNFCDECGTKLKPKAKFCPKCGKKMNT